jgi:hypothetical protein
MYILTRCAVQEAKSAVNNLIRQLWIEGFNFGIKGLKCLHLQVKGTRIHLFHMCQNTLFANFFMQEVDLVTVVVDFCLETLDQEHDCIACHLLFGFLKLLKAVLIHNERKHPSVPVTCAIHVQELLETCTL